MRLGRPAARRRARAACESALAADLDGGTAGDRYQVVVHVDAEVLQADAESGQAALEDGLHVPAETVRRMACDAATVTMRHNLDGTVLDVGRKTRTIPPAIRRALTNRDQRCRFPGCDCHHCDAHHVRHWADGGTTKLENLVLLCRRHHRAVHEEGFRVELRDDGAPHFFWPDGRPLPEAPSLPHWCGPPLQPTTAHLESGGIAINADTATPDWHGERLDLDWAILVLHPPAPSVRAVNDVPTETPPALPPGPVLDTAPS